MAKSRDADIGHRVAAASASALRTTQATRRALTRRGAIYVTSTAISPYELLLFVPEAQFDEPNPAVYS